MGDKLPATSTVKGRVLESVVSPIPKSRKKQPIEAVASPKRKTPTPTTRKKQTAAQRAASLANLAKAREARTSS